MHLAVCPWPCASHSPVMHTDSCGLLAEVLRGRFEAASGSSVQKNSVSLSPYPHLTARHPPHSPGSLDERAEATGGERCLKRWEQRWNAGREHNVIWHSVLHYGWLTRAQPRQHTTQNTNPQVCPHAFLRPPCILYLGASLFYSISPLPQFLRCLCCWMRVWRTCTDWSWAGGLFILSFLAHPSWDTVRRHFSTRFAEDWLWLTASYLH